MIDTGPVSRIRAAFDIVSLTGSCRNKLRTPIDLLV